MTPSAPLPLADVRRPEDRFRCEPYACVLMAGACVRRQDEASVGLRMHLAACRDCADGRALRERLGSSVAIVDQGTCGSRGCTRPAVRRGRCHAHGAALLAAITPRGSERLPPTAPAPTPAPAPTRAALPVAHPRAPIAPRSTMPAPPASAASAAVVAAIRSLSPELLGALVLEHATDAELVALFGRAIGAPTRSAPERPERAASEPQTKRGAPQRRFTPDDERRALAAATKPVAAGAIAAAIGRSPDAVRPLCARLVRSGKLVATGATSQRRYQVAA